MYEAGHSHFLDQYYGYLVECILRAGAGMEIDGIKEQVFPERKKYSRRQ